MNERDLFYLTAISAQGISDRISFKINEVEKILGINKEKLIEDIASGKLKCKRFSQAEIRWRISVQWILDYYRKYSTPGE